MEARSVALKPIAVGLRKAGEKVGIRSHTIQHDISSSGKGYEMGPVTVKFARLHTSDDLPGPTEQLYDYPPVDPSPPSTTSGDSYRHFDGDDLDLYYDNLDADEWEHL